MPEQRRRIYATQTGRVAKTIDAPLRYVYAWCTDFRSDDGRFSRARPRHQVVRVSPRRLVRIGYVYRGAPDPSIQIELVRLYPPNAWHKDSVGQEDLDSADYQLTALGPKRTRFTLVMVERWLVPKYPKKSDWIRSASDYWDVLVNSIEEQYRSGRPAKA